MSNFNYIISPLDQFEIRNYLSIDAPILFNTSFSLTNIGGYIIISTGIIIIFHMLSNNQENLM